jgi:REP element-mobilizing transposase RayT
MKTRKNRIFREGYAHHVYLKALNGNILFYRTEDYVFFLTLVYILAKRHGIGIEAVCIMFNHVHLFVRPVKRPAFEAFLRDLQRKFSFTYNKEYGHKGPLMMPSGYAPKASRKSINSCLIYIFNNPVEGGITKRAVEYKWNLLAYSTCDHPFSERLVKRNSRFRMRWALKYVDYCFEKGGCLDYSRQKLIFDPLTSLEKKQIIDYIVCKYNPTPKGVLDTRFGSYDNSVIAIDSTNGSEHDIIEAREDYSVYAKMLRISYRCGTDLRSFRFRDRENEDLERLIQELSTIPKVTPVNISRFLHLKT